MDIHIFWEGPYSYDAVSKLDFDKLDADQDYGIYQIYGHHPLYGSDVLLYLGMAQGQTFRKRLLQEKWLERTDGLNTEVYVGRLAGKNKITEDAWNDLIEQAEKLLIYAHVPVFNTQSTKSLPEENVLPHRIYNWGAHRDLFPEVSGNRFTSKFNHIGEEHIFDLSRVVE